MKVKSKSEVAQSYPTPSDPMDFSLPGSSVHGIFQARVLEWGAIAFSVLLSTYYQRKGWGTTTVNFNTEIVQCWYIMLLSFLHSNFPMTLSHQNIIFLVIESDSCSNCQISLLSDKTPSEKIYKSSFGCQMILDLNLPWPQKPK